MRFICLTPREAPLFPVRVQETAKEARGAVLRQIFSAMWDASVDGLVVVRVSRLTTRLQRTDLDHLAGLDGEKCLGASGHERQ